ncbi:MAG: amidohydrolase family protein [Treponema sp.]|nr:amidohydrolase family protein [Treponema sp.]
MFDLLITGGLVIDGSGDPAREADVGIQDGKIAAVETRLNAQAARTIELGGQIVSPGFIDIHRHADAALFRPDCGESELRQGITSLVTGPCGMSLAPLPAARRETILAYLAPVTGSLPPGVPFETFAEYAGCLSSRPLPLNAAALIGSGTTRAAVMGYGGGSPDAAAISRMQAVLEAALAACAAGVSIGLSYLPDAAWKAGELAQVLAPLGGTGKPLVCHVRGEGDLLCDSIAEVITLARHIGAPLHISHFKCIGRRNWGGLVKQAIAHIDTAREEGMTVTCDAYPWTAGSTQMLSLLPPAFCEGGLAVAARRLRDKAVRSACREQLLRPGAGFENVVYGIGWESIYISGLKTEANRPLIGKNVAEIAAIRQCDPFDAAFDLLVEEDGEVTMIDYITCEDDIDTIMRLPYTSIISDSLYSEVGLPHPRRNANIPQVFHTLVAGRRVLTLEQAVHKLSGLPATTMALSGKGFIRPGYDADIAIFKPENISPPADYGNPEKLTDGFDYVLIAGMPVLAEGKLTGAQAGRFVG